MFKWIHHILNPHCKDCELEAENKKNNLALCNSCETLREQLSFERREKDYLLRKLIEPTAPKEEVPIKLDEMEPIHSKHVLLSARRQMMEENSRAAAEILRKKNQELEDLALNSVNKNANQKQEAI